MPIDQFKLSIEGRPLLSLYSKYSIGEVFSSQAVVRPLGRVRTETPIVKTSDNVTYTEVRDVSPLVRYNTDTELIMNRSLDSDRYRNLRKSEHIFNNLETREKEPGASNIARIRRQEFENKFKIAASRANGQDTPPLKPTKEFSKKVIHLPCFQINLRTYEGEREVTRAVARTRESLRQLLDIQKSKAKVNNMVAANIMNYEFLGPSKSSLNSARSSSDGSSGPTLQPFPAKPAIRRPVRQRENDVSNVMTFGRVAKFGAYGNPDDLDATSVGSYRDVNEATSARRRLERLVLQSDGVNGESSALSAATSLTLGSTMYHLDGVLVKSPSSDELKEISGVLKRVDSKPDENCTGNNAINAFQETSHSQTPRSRHVMQRQDMDSSKEVEKQTVYRNKYPTVSSGEPELGRRHKPVLRYTSKPDSYKLDPIVVPSHTCTECSMCNLFQRDLIESPCPPNSPISSQFMDGPFCMGHMDPEMAPVLEDRATRKQPQLLPMSRITVNGKMSPCDDQSVRSYMKAKC